MSLCDTVVYHTGAFYILKEGIHRREMCYNKFSTKELRYCDGKGFAAVADESCVLADNSRETANHIQRISAMVKQAVEALSVIKAEADTNKEISNWLQGEI